MRLIQIHLFFIYATTLQTVRVSLQQATTILVSFISEQLELDLKRNVKVNEGELTQLEADLEAEEWEKVRFIQITKIHNSIEVYLIAMMDGITIAEI